MVRSGAAWVRGTGLAWALAVSALLAACGGGSGGSDTAAAGVGDGSSDTQAAAPKQAQATVPGVFSGNGWYWNPSEGGTGFMFEGQDARGFVAFFMYDEATGKPVWYAADGDLLPQADGSFAFAGDLRYYERGQAVAAPVFRSPVSTSVGAVSIRFSGVRASVSLPGGRSIDGQRFDFGGLGSVSTAVQPEVGWYYNPAEGGRGYAIEVQNGKLFMAMFHYNDDGSPTWHAVDGDISSGTVSNHFQMFTGGQSLTSGYRGPKARLDVGTYTLSFVNPCAGQLQLKGVAAVPVQRFPIGGRSGAAGSECRYLANGLAEVADTPDGAALLRPGDAVFGNIDSGADADAYRIFLRAGETYQVDLRGAAGGAGTLPNPRLTLRGPGFDILLANDDVSPGQPDARLAFTVNLTGTYYLVAQSSAGTGSFVLSVSGRAPGLDAPDTRPVSAFAGSLTGVVKGSSEASLSLNIAADGRISGTYTAGGATLGVTGSVAVGGAVQFSAASPGGVVSFSGHVDTAGKLFGSWSAGPAAGGVFAAANAASTVNPVAARPGCLDGTVANALGADDPFLPQSWHLANTGPDQLVSALGNTRALAGIDARVAGVHQAGRGCTGKGVQIGVVDGDLEIAHPDLAANVLPQASFNFETNGGDPTAVSTTDNGHGTMVGGILAGRGWNGIGSRGIAPFGSIAGYNLVGTTVLASGAASVRNNATYLAFGGRELADTAIPATGLFGTRADGISVYNYSAGADYNAPPFVSTNPIAGTARYLAAQWGTQTRRGGLGAVYFQSAGNEFNGLTVTVDGVERTVNCQSFRRAYTRGVFTNPSAFSCGNSNQEPYSTPFFYRVAAMHNTGVASSYSSAGAANWVTGFGGEFGVTEAAIVTTDRGGCSLGYNNLSERATVQRAGTAFTRILADLFGANPNDPNCNTTGRMNGTSAAAPSVSGVAALMLEANPTLSWRDVGYILAKTARRVDEGIATGSRRPTLQLTGASVPVVLDDPWITNAAGFSFQSRYGFGLVDAEAAVRLATTYSVPAGRRTTDLVAEGPVATELTTNQLNTGTRSFASVVGFANRAAITGQIRVELTVENTGSLSVNPGLLQFELLNRSTGTRSILLPAFTSFYDGGQDNPIPALGSTRFRFHTNAFLGETLDGDFEVLVRSFVDTTGGGTHVLRFTPRLTSFSL